MGYLLHLVTLTGLFATLALSLDLLLGYAGMLSLAQGAFYGFGAYVSALVSLHLGASLLVSALAGMGVAGVLAIAVSMASLHLRDDYFVMATFAIQMIGFSLFNNLTSVTGGSLGLSGLPEPSFPIVGLSVALAGIAFYVVHRLRVGAYGRVLAAIREDERLAESLAKDTRGFRTAVMAVSAMLTAGAGAIYAGYMSHVDPSAFGIQQSILIVSMVIVGGSGRLRGSVLGAALLVLLPEVLRFVGLSGTTAALLREITYGLLLVVLVALRPRGLLGRNNVG